MHAHTGVPAPSCTLSTSPHKWARARCKDCTQAHTSDGVASSSCECSALACLLALFVAAASHAGPAGWLQLVWEFGGRTGSAGFYSTGSQSVSWETVAAQWLILPGQSFTQIFQHLVFIIHRIHKIQFATLF